jgi:hypothetical protein
MATLPGGDAIKPTGGMSFGSSSVDIAGINWLRKYYL